MGPDSSNLPTPPESFILPSAPAAQPQWPTPQPNRPPSSQPPWALFAVVGTVVIVALLLGLLLLLRAGATPSSVLPPSSQTASAGTGTPSPGTSATATAQATATAGATATATTPLQPPAVQFVLNQATVSTGTPVQVSCPSGEVALSGGWATNGTAPAYNSTRDGNGWRIFPQGSSVSTNAYVMCLQNDPSASVVEQSQHFTVNANSSASQVVPCNPGEVAVGGGFANPSPGVEIFNFTSMGSGWGGYAFNHTNSSQVVTFYTECLTAPGAQVTFTSPASSTIAPGASGGTQVSCPAGTLLSGGGFVDDENAIVYNSSPNSNSSWGADILNQNILQSNLLNVYAMCLSLG